MIRLRTILPMMLLAFLPGKSIAGTPADDNTTTTLTATNNLYTGMASGYVVFNSDGGTTDNSNNYRIPSIVRVDDKTVLVFSDNRHGKDADPGPNATTDIVYRVYDPTTHAIGPEVTLLKHPSNLSYGDCATVRDRESGRILVVSTYGKVAYGNSNTSAAIGMIRQYIDDKRNADGSHTFTAIAWPYGNEQYPGTKNNIVAECTGHIYGLFNKQVKGAFFSSGEMCQSRIIKKDGSNYYRIYAALCARPNGTRVIYSDDFGKTWSVLGSTSYLPAKDGNEAKIVELPDGSLLLSSRINTKYKHGRYFNIFKYDDNTYTTGHWDVQTQSNTDVVAEKGSSTHFTGTGGYGQANGSVAILPAQDNSGNKVYIALQSMPLRDDGTDQLGIWWKVIDSQDDYQHVGYNGQNRDSYSSDADFTASVDPTLMAVKGDAEQMRYGWNKYKINDYNSGFGATNENNYSAMVDDGKAGIDILSEESRPVQNFKSYRMVYRNISLSTITGGSYSYDTSDREQFRHDFVAKSTTDNESPMPGYIYTIKVRWKEPQADGAVKIVERYLYSDVDKFYDNGTADNIKLVDPATIQQINPHYYWALQCDPKAVAKGNSNILQPFFYVSIFSGEGYLGGGTGWNYYNNKATDFSKGVLSPIYGNELKILEIHKMWADPNSSIANQHVKKVDGNAIVFKSNKNNGTRSVLAFDYVNGEVNWLKYSTSYTDINQDGSIGDPTKNDLLKAELAKEGKTPQPSKWSTDLIFTRVKPTSVAKPTTDAEKYGSLADPTYAGLGFEVNLSRSQVGAIKDTQHEDYSWYGTLRLPFATKVPQDVEVWYVKTSDPILSDSTYEQPVELVQATLDKDANGNRILPRETPVVLRVLNSASDISTTPMNITRTFGATTAKTPFVTGFSGTLGRMFYNNYSDTEGDGTYLYYVLARKKGRVAFYQLGKSTVEDAGEGKYVVPHNKAFFMIRKPTSAGAKATSIDIIFDNEVYTTGIGLIQSHTTERDSRIYDLSGRLMGTSLNNLPKGIYIVNGKKVIR